MADQTPLSEKESLEIITNMIQKAKGSYYETGVGPLLWGSVIAIASVMTYLQKVYQFNIGFDIWLIALIAIIPQIVISIREKRQYKVKKYEDDALNTVWLVFGISIFALNAFQNIVPVVTQTLIREEGWDLVKHYTDNSKPDESIKPFSPSFYSIYIMLYAFPTMVTGIVKKFTPMIVGGILAYVFFLVSCFTRSEYDWLLGGITAIVCWLIPGIILRKRYLSQKAAHV